MIRKLLLNYDLAIAYAQGEIKIREDIIESFNGVRRKTTIRAFIDAKIERDKFEGLRDRFVETRRELLENINLIVDRYVPDVYKDIFEMVFLKEMPYSHIAQKTGLSRTTIKAFSDRFKSDLIELYDIGSK